MKFKINTALLALPIVSALTLSGCVSSQLVSSTKDAIKDDTAYQETSRQALVENIVNAAEARRRDEMVDAPYLAGKSVALDREVVLPAALQRNVSTEIMFPGRRVTLAVAAERITLATGIPVKVESDVYLPTSALLPRSQSSDQVKSDAAPAAMPQGPGAMPGGAGGNHRAGPLPVSVLPPIPTMGGELPGVQGYSGAPAMDTPLDVEFQPGKMPLSRTLDLIATRLGINWKYDDQKGVIRFYRMVTKTWQLPIKPGSMSYTTAFSGSTMQSNNSNALNTVGGATSPIESKAQNIGEVNSVRQSIETLMTRAGSISADPLTGLITLTDTKETVDRADELVGYQTKVLSKMVQVRVQLIQVTTNDNGQAGYDWNAVLTKALAHVPGFQLSSISPVSLIGANGGQNNSGAVGLKINSGAFTGTSAIVQALAEIGRVSTSTEIPLSIQNRHGLYYNLRNTYSYVAATTPAQSTIGGTGGTPGITTAQDQVGFKLMIYPSVTAKNAIDMTVSIDQSVLNSLQTFTSGSGQNQQSVQLPNTTGEGATVDAIVKNGGTLILTGFEQKLNSYDRRTLTADTPIAAGGSVVAQRQRTTTIIVLSAAVQDADS